MAAERSMQVRLDLLVGDYVRNADRAGKATAGIGESASKPRSALEGLKTVGMQVGRTMVATAGIGAAAMAGWTANAFATGVAYNSLQQTAGSALETLVGSAEAATAQMAELTEFTRNSPFPRELWIRAQQTLIGFGVEAEKVVPIFSALQDGVVAVGGSAQQIEEVVLVLSKISSVGKVTAEDLNQLGERGIDAATLVGQAWGVTAAEVRDSMSQGAVDATEFIDTLVEAMGSKYGGAAEGLRETWVGALDRIAGATRDFGSVLAEPFVDPAGGGAAVEWANNTADALRSLEAIARPAMEVLSSQAEPAFQAASDAAERFADAIADVDLIAVIESISDGGPALAAFAAAATAAGSASALSAVGMGSLAAAISPVAAGVGALVVVSPELRSALVELLSSLAPLIPPATDLAMELAALASSGAGLAGNIVSLLAPALSGLVSAITPLIQFATGLVQVMDAIPGPVLAAALGVAALTKALMMLKTFTGALAIGAALETAFLKTEGGAKKAAGAVGGFQNLLKGLAAGVIVAGVVALANAFDDTADELERVRSVTSSGLVDDLEHLGRTGEATAGLKTLFGEGGDAAEGFADKLRILDQDWTDASWWNTSGNETDAAVESFRTLDAAMTEMVASGENSADVMQMVADAYDLNDQELAQLLEHLPQYTAEAERQSIANQEAAGAAGEYEEGLEGVGEQAEETKASLQDLADEMRAQTDPVFAAVRAMQDYEEAQQDYNDAVEEHGASSDEALEAEMALIEAYLDAAAAAGELAQTTGGELPPELIAAAEAAGISEEGIDALEEAFNEARDAGQEMGDDIANMNADLTDSTGRMAASNALQMEGMEADIATFAVNSKASVDALMDSGMSYAEAIAFVARESGRSTSEIEAGFEEAREKGLEFSDEYPAEIRLENYEPTLSKIKSIGQAIHDVPSYKRIQLDVQRTGDNAPSGEQQFATGGRVLGPRGAGDVVPAMLTPEEHVWTPEEVDAVGGHGVMEAMRAAALSGQTRYAQSSPPMSLGTSAASGPSHFTADAVIDIGGGVRQAIKLEFRDHDRDLKRRALAGTGNSR